MSTVEDHRSAWATSLVTPVDRADMASGSLHDAIYANLRQALVMGDFVPGQQFSMRALADRFQTSLIPVRDALKRLVAERGLMSMPNRTVCVPLMTRHTFQELLQVRLSLESMLARRGAELISRKRVAELAEINREMQAAVGLDDVKQYLSANYRFHFGLYGAANSAVMLPIVESLWMQVGPFLNAVFTSKGTKTASDNHAEVLKALRRRTRSRPAMPSSATWPTPPTSYSPRSSSSQTGRPRTTRTRHELARPAGPRLPASGRPPRRLREKARIRRFECRVGGGTANDNRRQRLPSGRMR